MNKKLLQLLIAAPLVFTAGVAMAQTYNDPFVDMTDTQIENLSDEQWESLIDEYEFYDDEEYSSNEYDDIDAEYGGEEGYTGGEDDWSGEDMFAEEDAFWDQVDAVITESDWDTLSDKQIDEKLQAAGLEVLGDPQDPLYEMTMGQMDALTDEEWDEIDAQYEELYGHEDWDEEDYYDEDFDSEYIDEDFEFDTEKSDIIEEVQEIFAEIKSELDADVAKEIKTIIDSLQSIDEEDEFFESLDTVYELAPDEIDVYFESEYGDIDWDEYDEEGFGEHNHDHDEDYEADADVVYSVAQGETFTVEKGNESAEAKRVVQWLKDISPDSLSDKYLKRLVLYTDAQSGEGASVGLNEDGTWDMAVNMSILKEGGVDEMKATLIHEMAHILTLNDSQVTESNKTCSTYKLDEGCANKDSYIASFYNTFWNNTDDSDDYDYERYEDNPKDFVTDYAATNPAEDLAETVAYFVLGDKPKQCDATVADQKVCSLYSYQELVEMRDTIRTNLAG